MPEKKRETQSIHKPGQLYFLPKNHREQKTINQLAGEKIDYCLLVPNTKKATIIFTDDNLNSSLEGIPEQF